MRSMSMAFLLSAQHSLSFKLVFIVILFIVCTTCFFPKIMFTVCVTKYAKETERFDLLELKQICCSKSEE
jgi:uncharacterized protein (UPF0333 family)